MFVITIYLLTKEKNKSQPSVFGLRERNREEKKNMKIDK
jgi:hypothetical protein